MMAFYQKIIIILITLDVLLWALLILLIAPTKKTTHAKSLFKNLQGFYYAHRGLHSIDGTIPENSLAAFVAAKEKGYGIELDVAITKDGQIIVFHDDTLERACDVSGPIEDFEFPQLSQFQLFKTQETIPLLSEVLEHIDGHVPLIVELKTSRHFLSLCEQTAQLLDHYQGPYCIESFDPKVIAWFKKNRPQVIRGQLSAAGYNFPKLPRYQQLLFSAFLTNIVTRPHFVAYRHEDSLHQPLLKLFKALGGYLVAWTVTNEEDHASCLNRFDLIIFEHYLP
jgi:glycerophosphoryl diester phosphodiesterase